MAYDDYWKLSYYELGNPKLKYISADYSTYDEEKIINIFKEIHPEWQNVVPAKISRIPFKIKKKINEKYQ